MSERPMEIQKRVSKADPNQPGLHRIDDDFRQAESDLYHHTREYLDYLLTENAALRAEVEHASSRAYQRGYEVGYSDARATIGRELRAIAVDVVGEERAQRLFPDVVPNN